LTSSALEKLYKHKIKRNTLELSGGSPGAATMLDDVFVMEHKKDIIRYIL